MRVLVTGSTGFIGSAVVPALAAAGHRVVRLVRPESAASRAGDGERIVWDPDAGTIDAAALVGIDAAIHLAGESIAGRWTPRRKRRIRESRVRGTGLLAASLAGLGRPPRVIACASATGFYGDRGDEILDESSAPGRGFLAEVVRDWEAAADPARRAGIRVVHVRAGQVLHPSGGSLRKMLPVFRWGLGAPLGRGEQFWSWIALDDLTSLYLHALGTEDLAGPVNAVAPDPVTNREFTRTLARVLGRPAPFAVPAAALRLAFGAMADEALLSSGRVMPRRAIESGFAFRHPVLGAALRALLGR